LVGTVGVEVDECLFIVTAAEEMLEMLLLVMVVMGMGLAGGWLRLRRRLAVLTI